MLQYYELQNHFTDFAPILYLKLFAVEVELNGREKMGKAGSALKTVLKYTGQLHIVSLLLLKINQGKKKKKKEKG